MVTSPKSEYLGFTVNKTSRVYKLRIRGLILLAWVVGGLLTLAGAFTYAELGAAAPEAGGQYVYINKAYG